MTASAFTFKTFAKTAAAAVVCIGLATQLAPTPAHAGGKGAILFGAGVLTGVVVNEAINNHHRNHYHSAPPPRRYEPRRVVTRTYYQDQAQIEENMEIQTALNTLGYNAGAVDGVIGQGTMAAIRTFQYELDESPTGYLTAKQKIVLLDRAERVEAATDNDDDDDDDNT